MCRALTAGFLMALDSIAAWHSVLVSTANCCPCSEGVALQMGAQAPHLEEFRLASSRVGPQGGIAIASALATGTARLV